MILISIKSVRTSKGMTQQELADRLKVKQSAISQWESGNTGPKRSRLAEIASILDCTIDDLMKEE